MNSPRDPNETADIPTRAAASLQADSPGAGDPTSTVDHLRGPASLEETHPRADAPTGELPEVPGYRVLREIARGGMGRVLAALDLTLEREVALKVLLPGARLDRFIRESKITARLPHPDIPPVYALGTLADGSPFLAMKLIAGRTLDAEIKSADRPHLLQAFTQVCQAVGFAHSRGIIHRDLKPANIMVGSFGEVQVMDWGLAKDLSGREAMPHSSVLQTPPDNGADLDQTGEFNESTEDQTVAGSVVGTPGYMAPEQARGELIDARADVFALGCILCKILIGRPPFTGKSAIEVIQRAAAADLAEANALLDRSGVDAELVGLCKRCLSPNLADRPANGEAVADGLSAYLNGVQERLQVVERERAVSAARAIEDRRRRRVQMIAGGLVLFALVAGITGTTIGLVRAREQRNLVEERNGQLIVANANTEVERDRAVQNLGIARGTILNMANNINQLESASGNPKFGELARKQALDEARRQFDQFREGQPDDMLVKEQAARLHRYSANVSRTLNDYKGAIAAYDAAIQISEDLTTRFPDNSHYRAELALTLMDRAAVERVMGKLNEAGATLDRALKLSEASQGKVLDSSYRRALGLILLEKSVLSDALGRFDDAGRFAERGTDLLRQYTTSPGQELQAYDPLWAAMAVHRVALAQRELGNTAKALVAHDDAVARMKRLAGPEANRDERHWDCEVRRERARTAVAVPERRKSALADLAEVIPIAEKLVEENPHLYFYKAGLASTYLYRGELLLALDKAEEATAELTKSLAVSRVLLDRHGVLTKSMLVRGNTFLALGQARAAAGKPDEAQAHWKNAAKVFELALRIDKDNFHHRRGLAEAQAVLKPPAK